MEHERKSIHGQWSSRWAFILAATGAAVGLGNIWKFPYIAGEHGGGAFVLIYLLCVVFIGIPLLAAEILLGRRGRQNPINTLRDLANESHHTRHWQWLGAIGILAGFLILSYYSVIAGWSIDYIFHAAAGAFSHKDASSIAKIFSTLQHSPKQMLAWHTVIMLITCWIVARGVEKGLESAIRIMFPAMLILLLVLLFYAADMGAFKAGLHFLFHPNFSKLSHHGTLVALGHAFFTLSVATGSIMMYGAYLPQEASIGKAACYIAIADTLVALIAGMVIFPIVFAHHLQPGAGPGLIFITLPIAFAAMPYGRIFATLFFVMLFFAALTSAISLIEPSIAFLVENTKLTRPKAVSLAGALIWLLGITTILSFNHWADVKILGLTIFDAFDYLTSNIMLPVGGVLIALFTAFLMQRKILEYELHHPNPLLFKIWRFCLGYLTPLAIVLVILDIVGVI